MNRNIYYVFIILSLVCSGAAFAQKNYSTEYKSVPLWSTTKGNSSAAPGKSYVFLDKNRSEMVLDYVDNPDQTQLNQGSENRRVVRFNLNNQVDASFASRVETLGQYFLYSYSVGNAKNARQAINTFLIPVPTSFQGDSIESPNLWAGVSSPSEIYAVENAIGDDSGKILSWYSQDYEASVIKPGSEEDGFKVTSKLKPGFSLAYVQGGLRPKLTSEIPPHVLEQTVPIMQIENNSQNVLILAPRYSQEAPLTVIAKDFIKGINRAAELGQVNAQSLAVKEAIEVLDRFLEKGNTKLNISAEPQTNFEAEILEAIKISLNLN